MQTLKPSHVVRALNILLVVIVVLSAIIIALQLRQSAKLDKMIELLETVEVTEQPVAHFISPVYEPLVTRGEVKRKFPETSPVVYIEYEVPNQTCGSFKTYMDYRTITNRTSMQWALQQDAYTDEQGFRRYDGKYMIALGTYYSPSVGKEFRITLDSGVVVDAIVGDVKQDIHTDETNRFIPFNGNIVEFIVDVQAMDALPKKLGDVSVLGLDGSVIKIEEVVR
jgi:hypothetical protein